MNDVKVIRGDWKRRRISKKDQMVFMPDTGGAFVQLIMPNGSEHVIALDEADMIMDDLRAQVPPKLKFQPRIGMNSGRFYDFMDPDLCPVKIEDVAHHLAGQRRYVGALDTPDYTLAQHCVLGSMHTKGDKFNALMHDAHESVCGDMSTPFKQLLPDFQFRERQCAEYFARRFGFTPAWDCKATKEVDLRLLATEVRAFLPAHVNDPIVWSCIEGVEPLDTAMSPWPAGFAKLKFLELYEKLRPHWAPAVEAA